MNPIIKSLLWWFQPLNIYSLLGGTNPHPNIPTYAGLQHEKKIAFENQ
jgi:hypothetical protein